MWYKISFCNGINITYFYTKYVSFGINIKNIWYKIYALVVLNIKGETWIAIAMSFLARKTPTIFVIYVFVALKHKLCKTDFDHGFLSRWNLTIQTISWNRNAFMKKKSFSNVNCYLYLAARQVANQNARLFRTMRLYELFEHSMNQT